MKNRQRPKKVRYSKLNRGAEKTGDRKSSKTSACHPFSEGNRRLRTTRPLRTTENSPIAPPWRPTVAVRELASPPTGKFLSFPLSSSINATQEMLSSLTRNAALARTTRTVINRQFPAAFFSSGTHDDFAPKRKVVEGEDEALKLIKVRGRLLRLGVETKKTFDFESHWTGK